MNFGMSRLFAFVLLIGTAAICATAFYTGPPEPHRLYPSDGSYTYTGIPAGETWNLPVYADFAHARMWKINYVDPRVIVTDFEPDGKGQMVGLYRLPIKVTQPGTFYLSMSYGTRWNNRYGDPVIVILEAN